MKKIIVLIASVLLISLTSKSQGGFVKIAPENGTMRLMLQRGENFPIDQNKDSFWNTWSEQVYFIGAIQQDIVLQQEFIILKLKRTDKDTANVTYRMLDSLKAVFTTKANKKIGDYKQRMNVK